MVNSEDVSKIAKLADIGVDDGEIEEFTSQCSKILTYFEMLDTLPQGKGVDRGLVNIFREDEVTESLSQEDALRNANESENGYFKAPRVM